MSALRRTLVVVFLLVNLLYLNGCCKVCPRANPAEVQKAQPSGDLRPDMVANETTKAGSDRINSLSPAWLLRQNKPLSWQLQVANENQVADLSVLSQGDAMNLLSSDPLTPLLVIGGLKAVSTELDALLKGIMGEIKSIGDKLQQNVQNVIADLDELFKDRLNQAYKQLNDTEKRAMEDAQALILQMQIAVQELAKGTGEQARMALYEADITAYDATCNALCRPHEPRFVYVRPSVLRAGIDRAEVTVRGNFLSFGPAGVKVDGQDATLLSWNQNEYVVRIPDAILNSVSAARSVAVSATPPRCVPGTLGYKIKPNDAPLAATFVVQPPVTYSINAVIVPIVKLSTNKTFAFEHYDQDENCSARRPSDINWCLPSDWEVTSERIDVHSEGCQSHVSRSPQVSGPHCRRVRATVAGCGTDFWLFCKGRGWVHYHLYLDAKSYGPVALTPYEHSLVTEDAQQKSFTIEYPYDIPGDNDGIEWTYNVTLVSKSGDKLRKVQLSDQNPTADGVTSRISALNSTKGKLAIEVLTDTSIAAGQFK